jgi:ABC-type Zn uptake system ZnuABC Zn-binding protein ZnuA
MTRITTIVALALAGLLPASAQAQEEKTAVVTTLGYLGDLARRVGGDAVEVTVLAAPGLDPHFIQPTPALSVKLREAQVFIENGIVLEQWAERVIDQARNANIRRGFPGHVFAANGIRPLQVPQNMTRASGHIHPGGNPHVWLDPLNLKHVARNIEQVLATARPDDAEAFAANRRQLEAEIDEAFFGPELLKVLGSRLLTRLQRNGKLRGFLKEKQYKGKPLAEVAGGWLGRAMAMEGLSVVTYHQVWTYFEDAFGIRVVATIEEKPGVPPSPGYLDQLERLGNASGTKVVMTAPYYPLTRAEGVAERLGGVAMVMPTQPGEVEPETVTDVFKVFDTIFDRLEDAVRQAGGGE